MTLPPDSAAYMPHEDPQGEYEEMLDRNNLACHAHECWRPATWRVECPNGAHLQCDEHRNLPFSLYDMFKHTEPFPLER